MLSSSYPPHTLKLWMVSRVADYIEPLPFLSPFSFLCSIDGYRLKRLFFSLLQILITPHHISLMCTSRQTNWKWKSYGIFEFNVYDWTSCIDTAESKNVNSHNADKVSGVGEAGPRLSSDREIGSVSMNKSKQAVEKQAVDASRPWTLSSNSNPDEADHEADFHEHELSNANASASNAPAPPALPSTSTSTLSPTPQFRMSIDRRPASPDDGVSENEEYHSFESSDEDDSGYEPTGGRRSEDERRAETEARELERLRVLEAAGLLVPGSMNGDSSHPTSSSQPTALIRRRSTNTKRRRRRTPPETPNRLSIISLPPLHTQSNSHSRSESEKELPTTPKSLLQIDDAFDRYEQYRQQQNYRLSVSSFDTGPPSPNSLGFGFPPTLSLTSSHDTRDGRDAADGTNTSGQAQGSSSNSESKSYSSIFNFLSRSKTHLSEPEKPKLQISGPIFNNSDKSLNETANGAATGSGEGRAFGSVSCWLSKVRIAMLIWVEVMGESVRSEHIGRDTRYGTQEAGSDL